MLINDNRYVGVIESIKGVFSRLLCVALGVMCLYLTGCSLGGPDGKDGTIWYTGITNIENVTYGVDGDYYFDTDDYKLYQKENGIWVLKVENFGKPGTDGKDGTNATADNIELRVDNDKILWRYTTGADTDWKNLIEVSAITGSDGADGREIELRVGTEYIQWRYKIGEDTDWKDLTSISSLKGDDGATWLSGLTVPTNEGKNGDFYLNESTFDIYKKTDGVWNNIGNIKGGAADEISSVTSEYHKDLITNEEYYIFTFRFESGAEKTVRVEIPETIFKIELAGEGVYSRRLSNDTMAQVQIRCYHTDGTTEVVDVTEDMYVVDDTHDKPDFTVAGVYNVKISYRKCTAESLITVINGVAPQDVLSKYDVQLGKTLTAKDGNVSPSVSRFSIVSYLEIDKFESISINSAYTMSILAYDENYNYIGNGKVGYGNWLSNVTTFELNSVFDWTEKPTSREYSDTKYIRVVIKKADQTLYEEDMLNSGITLNYKSGEYSYTGHAMHIGANKCTTLTYNYTDVGTINVSQDGTVYGNYIFAFNANGGCNVYSLSDYSSISTFTLDKNDKISPHCNSVCFGSDYYREGDEFPLLYANMYNNDSSLPGVCNVYRIQREDDAFTSTLVQVIKIGFTKNTDYWPSSSAVRPYGNFLVDADSKNLYAYVMVDASSVTRYFKFNIPKLSEGVYDAIYDAKVVTLAATDILDKFDTEYSRYLQGGCCYDGKIYSLEGFTSDASNPPKLRVIDLNLKRQVTVIDLNGAGLTKEPEMIFVSDDKLYILFSGGKIIKFDFI